MELDAQPQRRAVRFDRLDPAPFAAGGSVKSGGDRSDGPAVQAVDADRFVRGEDV